MKQLDLPFERDLEVGDIVYMDGPILFGDEKHPAIGIERLKGRAKIISIDDCWLPYRIEGEFDSSRHKFWNVRRCDLTLAAGEFQVYVDGPVLGMNERDVVVRKISGLAEVVDVNFEDDLHPYLVTPKGAWVSSGGYDDAGSWWMRPCDLSRAD